MSRIVLALAPAFLVAGLTGCDGAAVSPPTHAAEAPALAAGSAGSGLAAVRAATARYHNVDAALADGYAPRTTCIYNTPGSKGIHYLKAPLVDAVVDPTRPEVLLYELTRNGRLRLVGVEFLVPAGAWDAAHASPPTLGEQLFMDRRLPPFGADFPNYALYVWVWRHNPSGVFEQYNPAVSCEYDPGAVIR